MSDFAIITIVAVFCAWQCSAIVFIIKRRRDGTFTLKGTLVFVAVGFLLAAIRISSLGYLDHRTRTHTLYEVPRVFWWLFLPDSVVVQLLPLTTPTWSPVVVYSVLIVGSFAWAFPILLFMMRQKTTRAVG